MNRLSDEQLDKISNIVREIEKLSDIEKLLLYLKLPCGRIQSQDVKVQRINGKVGADIFAKKPDQETTQTYTWILSHLEEDPTVSLPKQEVYDEYKAFCQINRLEPLCVADFGKAMKHVFPCIKPRRLGQRGNSRYCYSGLRKRFKIQPPSLPDIAARGGTNVSQLNEAASDNYCCQIMDTCTSSQQQTYSGSLNNAGTANGEHEYHQVAQHNQHSCQPVGTTPHNNQQQFSAYEVMNLKIESNDGHPSHRQNSNDVQQQRANSNSGGLQGNHYRSPSHTHDGNTCVNNHCQCNHTSNKLVMTDGDLDMDSCGNHMHQQQSPGGNYNLEASSTNHLQPQQSNRVNHQSHYNHYSSNIMQMRTGTPDDDDYVHNYQNLTSVDADRHLMSVSMHPLAQVHPSQQQNNNPTQQQTSTNQTIITSCCRPTTSVYNQPQTQVTPSTPMATEVSVPVSTGNSKITGGAQNSSNNNNDANDDRSTQQQRNHIHPQHHQLHHHQISQNPLQQQNHQTPFGQYQSTLPTTLQLNLTELGNPNLDYSIASPFQSPSTTPNLISINTGSNSSGSTISVGGSSHSSHPLQGGYYSTSSCLRYMS